MRIIYLKKYFTEEYKNKIHNTHLKVRKSLIESLQSKDTQPLPRSRCRASIIPLPMIKLFQILKDVAVKVLYSICQEIWRTQNWPQDWKRSVFNPSPKKGNVKECSNYHTIALISNASEVMLKILQARLQQYTNQKPPDVQAGFRKGRGTRDQIANLYWIIK